MSVDVEDWAQSSVDTELPITERFIANTHTLLELLAEADARATFFVLGLAAEKAPSLVRSIQAAGHEVQSHGFGHRLISSMTPAQFRLDILASKTQLEDLLGSPVIGYRAPGFSVTLDTLWALDVLSECGFEYDSSIFPVRTLRYGISQAPRQPVRLYTPCGHKLFEVPVASYRWGGRTWPTGGGGYLRLLPLAIIRRGIDQLNKLGCPATLYMHPHELDPEELHGLPFPVSWTRRLHQGFGRRGVREKLAALLRIYRFSSIRDAVPFSNALSQWDPVTGQTTSNEPAAATK